MKVHQIILTVIDYDDLGAEGVRRTIENARYPNHCISPRVAEVQTRDIGQWSDDHPLNRADQAAGELARLFSKTP